MFRLRRAEIPALVALLEAERDALLRGALDELGTLAARKERALAHLDQTAAGPGMVQVRALLVRNAALLEAAGAGIQAARQTLLAARTPPALGVYDADGRRDSAPATATRLERRA